MPLERKKEQLPSRRDRLLGQTCCHHTESDDCDGWLRLTRGCERGTLEPNLSLRISLFNLIQQTLTKQINFDNKFDWRAESQNVFLRRRRHRPSVEDVVRQLKTRTKNS